MNSVELKEVLRPLAWPKNFWDTTKGFIEIEGFLSMLFTLLWLIVVGVFSGSYAAFVVSGGQIRPWILILGLVLGYLAVSYIHSYIEEEFEWTPELKHFFQGLFYYILAPIAIGGISGSILGLLLQPSP